MQACQLFGMRRGSQSSKMAISRSAIWNSTKPDTLGLFSRKISDVNDVHIVNFTWCYVLFDTVKVCSVKCCRLAVGGGDQLLSFLTV